MGSPGMTSWKDSRPELLALLWVLPGLTERALTGQIAWNGIRHTAIPAQNRIRTMVKPTVYDRKVNICPVAADSQ